MIFQRVAGTVEIDSDCYHVNIIVVNNVMDVSCIQRGGHRIPTPPPIGIIREYEEGNDWTPHAVRIPDTRESGHTAIGIRNGIGIRDCNPVIENG